MDRFRQKSKKESPIKYVDKDKSNTFMADVKSMKENLKIREILRTVKMNSSMRIKAPRGSKIMQNKDFNDNDDFDEVQNGEEETPSATNQEMVRTMEVLANETLNENSTNDFETSNTESIDQPSSSTNKSDESNEIHKHSLDTVNSTDCSGNTNNVSEKTEKTSEEMERTSEQSEKPNEKTENDKSENASNPEKSVIETPSVVVDNVASDLAIVAGTATLPKNKPLTQIRERKLSLDQTMLNRRESLSQSELDLHLIGKSPLERKSSFFRKKMESFLKNTTEIFKRQSSQLSRRGSMSVSLQSLNENTGRESEMTNCDKIGSNTSLMSTSTVGRSDSSLSATQGDQLTGAQAEGSLTGSQAALSTSQPIGYTSSESINSLNEAYIQDSPLNSRAISMSSGLDTAHGTRVRKSRSNRVTWLASEGLTNYLRRVIQDEKNQEIQGCHSYQDLSSIPENHYGGEMDSKGRRLSYQRAVSGEDPVLPTRYQDTSLRKNCYTLLSTRTFHIEPAKNLYLATSIYNERAMIIIIEENVWQRESYKCAGVRRNSARIKFRAGSPRRQLGQVRDQSRPPYQVYPYATLDNLTLSAPNSIIENQLGFVVFGFIVRLFAGRLVRQRSRYEVLFAIKSALLILIRAKLSFNNKCNLRVPIIKCTSVESILKARKIKDNDPIAICLIRNKLIGKALEVQILQEMMRCNKQRHESCEMFGRKIRDLLDALCGVGTTPKKDSRYYQTVAIDTYVDNLDYNVGLGNAKVTHTPEFIDSFNKSKDILYASDVSIGAVLSQGTVGTDRPIAYASLRHYQVHAHQKKRAQHTRRHRIERTSSSYTRRASPASRTNPDLHRTSNVDIYHSQRVLNILMHNSHVIFGTRDWSESLILILKWPYTGYKLFFPEPGQILVTQELQLEVGIFPTDDSTSSCILFSCDRGDFATKMHNIINGFSPGGAKYRYALF
ncbi:hypothetical protein ABMA28_000484 [Loxostege sticticalis]|uniref:Uncharacterized protein n=1 Tax=Loxostege sticticalis TaxID=481309 RepID=A0ABD0TSX2_LOXSC